MRELRDSLRPPLELIFLLEVTLLVLHVTVEAPSGWLLRHARCILKKLGSTYVSIPELIQPKRRPFHSPLTAFR